jgi:excisionase family DNA binding protein
LCEACGMPADYVRVSEDLIRKAIKSGYLVAYPIGTGTQYRLRAEDIDEWMMSRSTEPRRTKYLG